MKAQWQAEHQTERERNRREWTKIENVTQCVLFLTPKMSLNGGNCKTIYVGNPAPIINQGNARLPNNNVLNNKWTRKKNPYITYKSWKKKLC